MLEAYFISNCKAAAPNPCPILITTPQLTDKKTFQSTIHKDYYVCDTALVERLHALLKET